MPFVIRTAEPEDAEACIALRGVTRENPISAARLEELGITVDSWSHGIASSASPGWVAFSEAGMSGYCFGASETGEILYSQYTQRRKANGWANYFCNWSRQN